MGTFFVLPVYLQVVLGLDAFETGKRLLPMSVTMLIAALAGPKLAARLAPRLVVQVGLGAMVVAALVLVGTIDVELNETGVQALARAVRRRRRAADVAARQRDHVLGAARRRRTRRAASRAPPRTSAPRSARRSSARSCSPACSPASTTASPRTPRSPSPCAPRSRPRPSRGSRSSRPSRPTPSRSRPASRPAEADAVTADYADAQLDALKKAMLAVALLALLSLVFTRRLPGKPSAGRARNAGLAFTRDCGGGCLILRARRRAVRRRA